MKKIDKFSLVRNNKKAAVILRKYRWEAGIYCTECGSLDDIVPHGSEKSGIKRYFCKGCGCTFNDKSGTVFAHSKLSLWQWIYVIVWLLESTSSLSAAEIARHLDISYVSAHRMMKKLRGTLFCETLRGKLKGILEADEAWIGKKDNQQIVLGIVERDGSLKIFPIQDRTITSMITPFLKYTEPRGMLCTDSHKSYEALNFRHTHHSINHSKGEFAWRDIHTNTIEGAWGLLKNTIRTIHHGVKKKYLMDYIELFCFKYSHRKKSEHDKFALLFSKMCQPRYCLY